MLLGVLWPAALAKEILATCIICDTIIGMTTSSIIHARIDTPTKKATERVLSSLGLTPTEAIRLLYRQIALRGEFPLELRVPNELTAATLSLADQGVELENHNSTETLFESWKS